MPTETTGKSHESNVKIVHEKQREFRESESGKPLGSEETILWDHMIGPKKESLIVGKQQEHLINQLRIVVEQKVAEAHLDSQTGNFQQTHIQSFESQVEHKNCPSQIIIFRKKISWRQGHTTETSLF